MRTTVVVSQCGGTGKTTLAIAVAVVLARAGKKVGLVDLDFGGSLMMNMLSMPEPCQLSNGLVSFSSSRKQLAAIRSGNITLYHGVYVIPANTDPAERFFSNSEEELVGKLEYVWQLKDLLKRKEELGFDHVLLDTPPGDRWLSRAAVTATKEKDCIIWCTRNGVEEAVNSFLELNYAEMPEKQLTYLVINPNHEGNDVCGLKRTTKPGYTGEGSQADFWFNERKKPLITNLPNADNEIEQRCLEDIAALIDATDT